MHEIIICDVLIIITSSSRDQRCLLSWSITRRGVCVQITCQNTGVKV